MSSSMPVLSPSPAVVPFSLPSSVTSSRPQDLSVAQAVQTPFMRVSSSYDAMLYSPWAFMQPLGPHRIYTIQSSSGLTPFSVLPTTIPGSYLVQTPFFLAACSVQQEDNPGECTVQIPFYSATCSMHPAAREFTGHTPIYLVQSEDPFGARLQVTNVVNNKIPTEFSIPSSIEGRPHRIVRRRRKRKRRLKFSERYEKVINKMKECRETKFPRMQELTSEIERLLSEAYQVLSADGEDGEFYEKIQQAVDIYERNKTEFSNEFYFFRPIPIPNKFIVQIVIEQFRQFHERGIALNTELCDEQLCSLGELFCPRAHSTHRIPKEFYRKEDCEDSRCELSRCLKFHPCDRKDLTLFLNNHLEEDTTWLEREVALNLIPEQYGVSISQLNDIQIIELIDLLKSSKESE